MRIAIVEDDPAARQQLKTYVLKYFEGREKEVELSVFCDGDEIVESYRADYDLIFLDIQMKRMDGMETAERIRRMDENVFLVFITNMANYAIRGYSVHALDFILKPVNYLMLQQLLTRVEHMLSRQPRRCIPLPTESGIIRMDVSQIYYVETESHAVTIETEKGAFRLRQSMRSMEEMLREYDFFRCNSCYLVNLAHVEQIADGTALVAGHPLAISRPRHKAFMEALTRYIGGMKA